MSPENPERPRITKQLKMYVEELDQYLDAFVPDLIKEANGFYEYHDYSREEEKWWSEVADRQLRDIFKDYERCSVDIVSLDRDLDDLKGPFGHIRRREGKYYETMNGLIDSYDVLFRFPMLRLLNTKQSLHFIQEEIVHRVFKLLKDDRHTLYACNIL